MIARGGVLALDLSLTTGWAIGRASADKPVAGVWRLPSVSLGASFSVLDDNLSDFIEVHRPSLVFFEAPLPDVRQTSARLLLGLASHVESTCYRYNVQCREQAVQTIRLAVMGRGRFPTGTAKAHVMAWCNARGWAPEDDNAADAMVAWCFAIRELTAARKRVA